MGREKSEIERWSSHVLCLLACLLRLLTLNETHPGMHSGDATAAAAAARGWRAVCVQCEPIGLDWTGLDDINGDATHPD